MEGNKTIYPACLSHDLGQFLVHHQGAHLPPLPGVLSLADALFLLLLEFFRRQPALEAGGEGFPGPRLLFSCRPCHRQGAAGWHLDPSVFVRDGTFGKKLSFDGRTPAWFALLRSFNKICHPARSEGSMFIALKHRFFVAYGSSE